MAFGNNSQDPNRQAPSKPKLGLINQILIIAFVYFVAQLFFGNFQKPQLPEMAYGDFIKIVEGGDSRQVRSVYVKKSHFQLGVVIGEKGKLKEAGKEFIVNLPREYDYNLDKKLIDAGIAVIAEPVSEGTPLWQTVLLWFGPTLLFIVFWIFLLKRMGGFTGAGAMNQFNQFKEKIGRVVTNSEKQKITFEDVGGIDEAREEVKEIVDFLRNPYKFARLGGKIPKGVLIIGPPGTGKTLLARVIASEANAEFISISGSEFVEMFVGVGASRVRSLFQDAKARAPSIIFIDELDAVGKARSGMPGFYGGHDERDQTLNQMLVEMDGFDSGRGVIVVAATNRPDILDPALLRPGRFDRRITLHLPDVRGREEILKIHTRKLKMSENVNLAVLAKRTPGFSGADLENMANEAALGAGRKDKKEIGMEDFNDAIDKVLAGEEQRSRVISPEEKEIIAAHEAGHTIVALNTPGADPVHKVSIIPRGRSLGATWQVPEKDRLNVSRQYLLDRVAILYGGRAAEEILFNEISAGAHDDISKATEILKEMVYKLGMGENLPLLDFSVKNPFWSGSAIEGSSEALRKVDEEVKRLSEECRGKARNVLMANLPALKSLKQALLEKESLEREEILRVVSRTVAKES